MTSKKRSVRKSDNLAPDIAVNKVLKFFNNAKTAEELSDAVFDDPTFGKSKGAYGIRKSIANNILHAREKLPGGKFTQIKQIDQVYGVGDDTINDIFYSFYSDVVKQKIGSNKIPEVILDFVCENNLLYIIIENIGNSMAYDVAINFDKTILGLNAEKNISEMQIFKNISVIPPQKSFKIFVDTFFSYVQNKQPLVLTSQITYRDSLNCFDSSIKHNLKIYKDYTCTLGLNNSNFS